MSINCIMCGSDCTGLCRSCACIGYTLTLFVEKHAAWSRQTFGGDLVRGPVGGLLHLEKEAREAVAADGAHRREEIADCFMLVLDSARRAGMSITDLIDEAERKLAKVKTRTYPPAVDGQPCEHIRDAGAPRA